MKDPYVPEVSKTERHQNLSDLDFLINSPKNYGVYVATRFDDNNYFNPELEMFVTRSQAYKHAKDCKKRGDKIIGFVGFKN